MYLAQRIDNRSFLDGLIHFYRKKHRLTSYALVLLRRTIL